MKIASIEQALLSDEEMHEAAGEAILMTKVTLAEVESVCILSRLLISALGRPGRESDMQLFTSGDQCIVMWTRPQLSLEAATTAINQAIAPSN
jgi:hypothetical protein